MNKPLRIVISIAIGLPIGYYGREALQVPIDRPRSAMAMFDTYCAPFSQRNSVEVSADLVPLFDTANGQQWADPQSRIILDINPTRCEVSDALIRFNPQEREAFAAAVRSYIDTEFPMLEPTQQSLLDGDWDLMAEWSQYSRKELRHWRITLGRAAADGPDSQTVLSVFAPAG